MTRDDGSGGPAGDFRVRLRELAEADEDEFLRMAQASADLHHPWYSAASTPEEFRAYLIRLSRSGTEGRVVCVRDGGAMAGLVTLDTIVRGRFQSASISYGAFALAAGRGYMTEGVRLMLWYAFQELRLHRVEASIQPGNEASLRLVRRLGFRQEGYSPDMLFIDGAWRDHVRWAITREMTDFPAVDPHPTQPAR
jgi:[ribosomal protein S5]-alanine N-acetyltransferase